MLESNSLEEFEFIKVKFLLPNTTSLPQPIGQQAILNFKKLYTNTISAMLRGDLRNKLYPLRVLKKSCRYKKKKWRNPSLQMKLERCVKCGKEYKFCGKTPLSKDLAL